MRWSTGEVERFEYDDTDRLVRQSSARSRRSAFGYDGDSMFPSRIEVAGDQGLAVELEWDHGSPTRIVDSDGVVDILTVRRDGTVESVTERPRQHHPLRVDAVRRSSRASCTPTAAPCATNVTPPAACSPWSTPADSVARSAIRRPGGCCPPPIRTARSRRSSTTRPVCRLASSPPTATRPDVAFDDKQRVVGVRFANGDSIGLELDEFGRRDRHRGRRSSLDDRARRVRAHRQAGAIPTVERSPSSTASSAGWMTITDAAGASWRLERDLVEPGPHAHHAIGTRMTAEYSADGLLTSQTTTDGREQDDPLHLSRPDRVESPLATRRIEFRYDAAGRMIGGNSGTGWWTFDLDSNGRIVRRVSPAGREQRYGYNVLDQLTSINVGRRHLGVRLRHGRALAALDRPDRPHVQLRVRPRRSHGRIAGRPRHAGPLRLRPAAAASPRWSTATTARSATSTTRSISSPRSPTSSAAERTSGTTTPVATSPRRGSIRGATRRRSRRLTSSACTGPTISRSATGSSRSRSRCRPTA